MTDRETLLARAEQADRQMMWNLDKALSGGTAWRQATAEWAIIARDLRTRAASYSPMTNGEVSEPPLKREGLYRAGGGHAPASGSRDGSEILAPAMEAARIPAAPEGMIERAARALRKVHNHMTVEQLQGGMDMDLIRAQAAIAALSAIPIPATGEADHSKLIGDLRTVFGGESEGWSTIRTATLERAIAALLIPATGELEKALRKAAARLRLASDGPEDKATIRKWSDEALAATKGAE